MSNIMVTGGSGFMGPHLVKTLALRGDNPLIYDIFPPSGVKEAMLNPVKDKIKFVRGNYLDLSTIVSTIKTNEIDKVVHLARYLSTPISVKEPLMAKFDIEGILTILEAVRLMDVKRIVFMSSQQVYGPRQYFPVDEDHPKLPTAAYGTYKLASEYFGLNYDHHYGVDFIALRPSGPYGLGDSFRHPISFIVQNAVKGVPVHLPSGGSVYSDSVYVKDIVNGILLALDVNKSQLQHRIFNIAYGEVVSVFDAVEIIKELLPEAEITVGVGKKRDRGAYSIERARKELGYAPKYDLRAGLTDYVESARTYLGDPKEVEDLWWKRM